MTSVHYNNTCIIDKVQKCYFYCAGGRCAGENECTSDAQCRNFCDTSTGILYKDSFCNNLTGTCFWKGFETCDYGCNELFDSCNMQPLTTSMVEVVMGYTGLSIYDARTFLALIISSLISAGITFFVSYRGGIGEGSLIFITSFIALIIFFAVITPSWINPIVMMLLIIFSGLVISWKLVQAVGG